MHTGFSPLIGQLAALLAAFLWAVSSVLFKRLGTVIRPLELNLLKGVLAVILMLLTSLLLGEQFAGLSLAVVLWLMLSGALGIGFGDTMYFEALNQLGARRTLLLGILAPPLASLIAAIVLGETLNLSAWAGILLTMLGVAWVITEQPEDGTLQRRHLWRGVLFGFLAALTQAIGAVISHWALTRTPVSSLQSAIIRLLAGILFLLLWAALRRQKLGAWIKPGSTLRMWAIILLAVLIGTYLAIWLQQFAFQHASVGIAQTLLATSPLFILPISALMREKVSLRAVLGVLVSTAGICLLFLVA